MAGYYDVKTREVPDWIWVAIGILGAALLLLTDHAAGGLAIATDLIAVFFVMEHFIPWEDLLGESDEVAVPIEAAIYIAVSAFAVYGYFLNPDLVSTQFLAIVVSVLIARGLFESRLLYGGADAKALIALSLLLPLLLSPLPLLVHYPSYITLTLLPYIPFPFTVLIDGALLTLVVPLVIFARNLRNGFRELPDAFFIYEIPTKELPERYVWLRRPMVGLDEDAETAEEDHALRLRQTQLLLAGEVESVFVTPQLPMVAALAGGALVAILFGNLLFLIF